MTKENLLMITRTTRKKKNSMRLIEITDKKMQISYLPEIIRNDELARNARGKVNNLQDNRLADIIYITDKLHLR